MPRPRFMKSNGHSRAASEHRVTPMSFGAFSRLLAFVIAICASGCTTSANQDSPNYQAGFGDGCLTASREKAAIARSPVRNDVLYGKDNSYRSGWISGQAACRDQPGPPHL